MKTVDVSGFGGGYEHTCQKMIQAAMEYMKEHGVPEDAEFKEDTSERVKGIEKVMMTACDNDCTGAMFFTARGHARQRVKMGDEWYFDQFKDDPTRVYEWDGTVDSVPKTELSEKMDQKN